MIDKLKQIEEKILLDLLNKPEIWNSLMIDYHPPIVERLWTQIGNYRILLHFIHKCEAKDALFHPHPWSSAVHVLTGQYEMGIGFGKGLENPVKIGTIFIENGSTYYDLTHIDSWHYVRPVKDVCATVMLIGPKWDREEIKSEEPLKPMDEFRKSIILEWFKNFYSQKVKTHKIIKNEGLKRGSWAILDESVMTENEKKSNRPYFNRAGFVISRNLNIVDIRFGNDRIQVNISNLILLDDKNRLTSAIKDENDHIPDDLDERFI